MTVPSVASPRLSALHTIQDEIQKSTVRLHAKAMGRGHGLDSDAIDRLDIIVCEMANNISRHADTGQMILRQVGEHASGCIEILALDKGPGIADMTRIMRDCGSSAGSGARGGGLATIRRFAELFDLYSQPGHGTAIVAHVGIRTTHESHCRCSDSVLHGCVGVVCVPLHGQEECGDDWAIDVSPGRVAAVLVDGLGHGAGAAVAALAGMSAFHDAASRPPELMLPLIHDAMHTTRGAALSITVIDQAAGTARFCGVGNVDGRIVSADENRNLIPQNGIVGHNMPRPLAVDVPWTADARLVMHSDGLSSRWRPDSYPGLVARHPALLAGVLFRDFARARDDATVLVIRGPAPTATA